VTWIIAQPDRIASLCQSKETTGRAILMPDGGWTEARAVKLAPILISCVALGVSVFTWYYSNLHVVRSVLATLQDANVSVSGGQVEVDARFFVVNRGNRPAAIDSIMISALTAPENGTRIPLRERCTDPDIVWHEFFQGTYGGLLPPSPVIEPGQILSVEASFEFYVTQDDLYPADSEFSPLSVEQADACLWFYMIDDQGSQSRVPVPFFTVTFDDLELQSFEHDNGPWQLL
jgi:hypothetical protein